MYCTTYFMCASNKLKYYNTKMPSLPFVATNLSSTGARVRLGVLLYQCVLGMFEWSASTFPYSKFRHARTGVYGYGGFSAAVQSRLGMMLAYSAPLLAFVATAPAPHSGVSTSLLLYGMWVTHYVKRILEVLFIHSYSGGMPLTTALSMMLSYGFIGYAFGMATDPAGIDAWSALGMGLWVVGTFGNGWHHWLLAKARRGKLTGGAYVPLSKLGGLFGKPFTCPHYFFEVLAWLGYSLVGKTIYHYTTVLFFALYLSGRSAKTLSWYRKKGLV